MLSVIMLSVIMLSAAFSYCYAECHCAERHYAGVIRLVGMLSAVAAAGKACQVQTI
jgi:hypothetical protein